MSARGVRLDRLLVDRGLAPSRERAQRLILAGHVLVDDRPITKAGTEVPPDAAIRLREPASPYVSRGGEKLAGALDTFGISVDGKVVLDVGASTGGFTDVVLRRGARRVYAVDVGYGQLAWSLQQDARVVILDRTNARHLDPTKIRDPIEIAVIDVSFISLTLILPAVVPTLAPSAIVVALVKPQFELDRASIGKGGVVRDDDARARAADRVRTAAERLQLSVQGQADSEIEGPKGNREIFLWLTNP